MLNKNKIRNTTPFLPIMHHLQMFVAVFLVLWLNSSWKTPHLGSSGWKKAKEGEGITVFTRSVDASAIKEQKTVTYFNAPIENLSAIIGDIKNRKEWFKNCKSVEVVKKYGPGHFIYRMVIDMPFPLVNRELFQEMEIIHNTDNRNIVIRFETLPQYFPDQKGLVQIKKGYGSYTLTQQPDGLVKITLTSLNDPGKGVPAQFYNLFLAESPYRIMKHIKEESQKKNYSFSQNETRYFLKK